MSDRVADAPVLVAGERRYLNGRRVLRGLVLLAWSGFFLWLWISGEVSRYLGPRTYWVVPFGALTLGIAAVLHVLTVRSSTRTPGPSTIELVGAVMMTVPLVAVATVPNADLGTLAASRKSADGPVLSESLASGAVDPVENPTFRDIVYAEESSRYADAIGVGEGTEVELVGFVDDSGTGPQGTFELTRFYVSCCAADAVPYSVAVDATGQTSETPQPDTWVEVSGILEPREGRFVLVADAFDPVSEPEEPYLY